MAERATFEERVRHCESVFALKADLGALAAMSDEPSIAADSFHALARLAEGARRDVREIQRTVPAHLLNLTAGRTSRTDA